jgi:glutathione S-transferase
MKLYWARLSPFVRKVMIVAHETATAGRIELAETSVSMGEANDALLPDNPLSKIPTLVLDDGSSLYDSRAICEYLDSLHAGHRLFPAGPTRWDALRRHALGDGMMDALILWRQERSKPEERQTAPWIATFARKIEVALAQLDAEADRLSSLPFDIGHAALGSALRYMDVRFEDLGWRTDVPRLAAWHAAFEQRPSAIATDPLA